MDGRRILLVDDETSIVETIGSFLRDLGHEVTGAVDGVEALELLARGSFDVIISDIRMPRVGGMELLTRLRAGGDATPFILVSGHREEEVAVTTGPTVAYLRKPVRLADLLACMEQLCTATP